MVVIRFNRNCPKSRSPNAPVYHANRLYTVSTATARKYTKGKFFAEKVK
jgi:hypothetical protein